MTPLRATILLTALLTIATRPAAAQTTDIDSYALLAIEELHLGGVHVLKGNLGVTHGLLHSSRPLDAPNSEVAAETVRLAPYATCAMTCVDGLVGDACGTIFPFASIVDDVAVACGFPDEFPCAPASLPLAQPVPPGQYGNVALREGDRLVLAGGEYTFCSLRGARHSRLEFLAPATVRVRDLLRFGNGSFVGPGHPDVAPAAIRFFYRGSRVRFSRRSQIAARLCAPEASLHMDNGAILEGSFIARRIRVGRATVTGAGGDGTTTTTTTSIGASTTSTTSSLPSSTTRPPTTTTTSTATTSTSTSSTSTTVPVALEICGNCIDDDDNGFTDFEDSACCTGSQVFPLTLRKGRIRPRGTATSRLRLKTILAPLGLQSMNPLAEDVFLQIRPEGGAEIFCARVPANRFKKKRAGFRFRDRKHLVPSAQHLDDVRIRVRPNFSVQMRARGKRALLQTPAQGRLLVTVGFHTPGAGNATNRCSRTTATFRPARAGLIWRGN